MRARGINYDTGFLSAGTSTHEPFDAEVVRREMRIIRDDMHCTAVHVRDEDEHATYLREVLEVFDAEGVDAAFVYTFARYDLPHRDDPLLDVDRASAGVVKLLDGQSGARDARDRRYPDLPWEPKAAFDALADGFGR
jgi:hypothetical protein